MKRVLFHSEKDCCGCGACLNACPKQAISMQTNGQGFIYPVIDEEKCIDCGRCNAVCAFQNVKPEASKKETYAASSAALAPGSASGGLFAQYARNVLTDGGVVYGCAMQYVNGRLEPRQIRVDREAEMDALRGSKYVQSDTGSTFRQAKEDLAAGRTVLYSGTPCQIAGLRSFLGRDYDRLFTIDIICHGVPGAKLFQDYIRSIEEKKKKKVVEFVFRDKSQGWKLFGKMITVDAQGNRNTEYFEPERSSYYQLFLNSHTYRENCYYCKYAGEHRPGDITIGDFWCIDLVHPDMLVQNGGPFDEQKGISCMIINHPQGSKLFESYGGGIETRSSTFEEAATYNGQLKHPSVLTKERAVALAKYGKSYEALDRWYWRKQIPIIVVRSIRMAIPKPLKHFARKCLTSIRGS